MSDDSDHHPQVTLVGTPDSHGFTRVTRRTERPSNSTETYPIQFDATARMPTMDDNPPDSIVNDIMAKVVKLTMKLMGEELAKHTSEIKASIQSLDTRLDSLDAKLGDVEELVDKVETKVASAELDINELEAFQEDVQPKIDRVHSRPLHSSDSNQMPSDEDRSSFPRFSGYMGTRTSLQRKVSPDE